MTGRLLTARVVAQRLGLCTETVLAWQRDGTLPAHKLGKVIRFDEDELEAWLEEKRTAPRRGASTPSPDAIRNGTLSSVSSTPTEDEER